MKIKNKPMQTNRPAKKPIKGKKPGAGLKGKAETKDLSNLSSEVMSGSSFGKKDSALSQALLSAWK